MCHCFFFCFCPILFIIFYDSLLVIKFWNRIQVLKYTSNNTNNFVRFSRHSCTIYNVITYMFILYFWSVAFIDQWNELFSDWSTCVLIWLERNCTMQILPEKHNGLSTWRNQFMCEILDYCIKGFTILASFCWEWSDQDLHYLIQFLSLVTCTWNC